MIVYVVKSWRNKNSNFFIFKQRAIGMTSCADSQALASIHVEIGRNEGKANLKFSRNLIQLTLLDSFAVDEKIFHSQVPIPLLQDDNTDKISLKQSSESTKQSNVTFSYSSIATLDKNILENSITINFRHFVSLKMQLKSEQIMELIHSFIEKNMRITSIFDLLCFHVRKTRDDSRLKFIYNSQKEFERMGVGKQDSMWRFSTINENFTYSSTYPKILVVPSKVSDNVLKHIGTFRSKGRIPALSYIHKGNSVSHAAYNNRFQ